MSWSALLPPRPAHGRVALVVTAIIVARATLLTLYMYLGDQQAGHTGSFAVRLVEEATGALTALPLLVPVVLGIARWPLSDARWRWHLVPLFALFLAYSSIHTILMEGARAIMMPLVGATRAFTPAALQAAVLHELPNDLFYFSLFVASVELWRFWWRTSERERREAALQGALVEAQLTALRLQLQPHFLFNALNTVSSVMYDDPRRADAILGELAELLRASLRTERQDEIPLEQELDIAARYARLQRERFGDRLTVKFDVEPGCGRVHVPIFVLQPLIENAVRHGRAERLGTGTVRVVARRDAGVLRLEVRDDGTGAATGAAVGPGLGLRATAERLRLLYGAEATFEAGPTEQGWSVRITLPIRPEARP